MAAISRAVAIGVCLTAAPVYGAECNFDKPIGGCQARISIDSTSGSKGSYSAEATVRSSAPSCSKVEYFVDSTPYTTVIKSGTSESESFFGTNPISKKSLKVLRCTAFEDGSERNSPERQALVRRLGGCVDDMSSSAVRKLDQYNNDGSSLDSLIDFLPKAIAVNQENGDTERVSMLSGILATARECRAKQK